MSEFLRLAVIRVAKEKVIPFEIRLPNCDTQQAIQEARKLLLEKSKFNSTEALFDELEK